MLIIILRGTVNPGYALKYVQIVIFILLICVEVKQRRASFRVVVYTCFIPWGRRRVNAILHIYIFISTYIYMHIHTHIYIYIYI